MVFTCPICEEYTLYSVCSDCRKIRHYVSIYSKDRVLEILDNVLSRTEDKQDNKIKAEIKDEIEKKNNTITGIITTKKYTM